MEDNIELSVIAPMFNEEMNVTTTLSKLTGELDKLNKSYEIIFVNDGSTDNTLKVCEQETNNCSNLKIVSYENNQGRGKALKEGFGAAKGKYVFVVDFDLSYDASHITRMYNTLISNSLIDIVLVSAYMNGGATIGVPKMRLFISRLGNFLLSYAFSKKIYTSTCIVRGYKHNVIRNLSLDSNGKEIHLEILSKALALGYKIVEIPGTMKKRMSGKSKFRFKNTSKSHLIFIFMERPAHYFFIFGTIFLLLSITSGMIVLYNRIFHGPMYSFLYDNISPLLVIFLSIFSVFFFIFSLSGKMYGDLRKEILKTQAILLKNKSDD